MGHPEVGAAVSVRIPARHDRAPPSGEGDEVDPRQGSDRLTVVVESPDLSRKHRARARPGEELDETVAVEIAEPGLDAVTQGPVSVERDLGNRGQHGGVVVEGSKRGGPEDGAGTRPPWTQLAQRVGVDRTPAAGFTPKRSVP